ncbi:unnamed protein product [Nippostrongylus brasiliensis]|uniref:Rieske domain-containing protein n=1 Tax=Nippostrongylus brasiliensis TaxID=27835 RepID=A0A0N4XVU5_NIPBR|nr:unnamed protein product [Nippostrongylus brasiliensis]
MILCEAYLAFLRGSDESFRKFRCPLHGDNFALSWDYLLSRGLIIFSYFFIVIQGKEENEGEHKRKEKGEEDEVEKETN